MRKADEAWREWPSGIRSTRTADIPELILAEGVWRDTSDVAGYIEPIASKSSRVFWRMA
jgi:hypothetical protein